MANKEEKSMDLTKITLEDCIELYERKGICIIANDGQIVGFEQE